MTETSIGIGGPEDKGLSLGVQRVAAPLREQVLDLLRQAIVEHRLKPGQRLIERELVEQIGVSRTTIREVLRQLAAEGLVATIPQRGAVVAVPTAEEAAELYEVRAALESLAARRFVEHASESQVTALRAAYEEVARVMSAGDAADTLAMIQSKDLFYDVLLKGSGNRAIHSILSGLDRARERPAGDVDGPSGPGAAVARRAGGHRGRHRERRRGRRRRRMRPSRRDGGQGRAGRTRE